MFAVRKNNKGVKTMGTAIEYLKEQLDHKGQLWKETKDEELMRDCLALIEAINALEERVYGESITTITYVL